MGPGEQNFLKNISIHIQYIKLYYFWLSSLTVYEGVQDLFIINIEI